MDGEAQAGGLSGQRQVADTRFGVRSVRWMRSSDNEAPADPASELGLGCNALLLAEADPVARERLAVEMAERGYRVQVASTLAEATLVITTEKPSFAVIDYRLPDGSGLALIPPLVATRPTARIVVLSRYASLRGAVAALRMGAEEFLARPAAPGEIDAVLRDLPAACRLARAPASSIRDVDRRHAEAVLRAMDANVPATARALGIETRTLRRLLARRPAGGTATP